MKHYQSSVPDDDPAVGPDEADPPRAPLDARSAHRIALRYREWSLLDRGGRAGRLEADRRIEDSEKIGQWLLHDLDPLPLLDALISLGVESDDELASRLPSPLPDLFPASAPEAAGMGGPGRRTGRRPSLRQDRTGRRGRRTV